jgi:hypothetical protein
MWAEQIKNYNGNTLETPIVPGDFLMIEIIFVRLATHLRFYISTLDLTVKFKYDSSKVKINQIVIIYF